MDGDRVMGIQRLRFGVVCPGLWSGSKSRLLFNVAPQAIFRTEKIVRLRRRLVSSLAFGITLNSFDIGGNIIYFKKVVKLYSLKL